MSVVPCTAGNYCPTGTLASQVPCTAGSYCPTGSLSPTQCPAGFYSPTGSTQCIICPTGTYCSAGSVTATNCVAGTYCPDGINQIPCPPGTRSTEGQASCSSININNGTYSGGRITCNPSFTYFNGQCYAATRQAKDASLDITTGMIVNTVVNNPNTTGIKVCPACYSLNGSSCTFSDTCSPTCNPGYIVNYNQTCVPCPIGYYSNAVTNKCVIVDAGSYSAGLLGEEFPCPAGTFSNPGARQCTFCPLGMYSAAGSSSCTPCSVGYYADKTGSATCTSCLAGYSTVSTKSISSSNCISCNQTCPAGKYISKTCQNPPDGAGTCLDCLGGQTLPGTTNYVSAVCGQTFRATLSTATLNPGNYFSSFDNGAYNRAVTAASWVQSACGTPDTSLLQYVVTACTTFANTILGVKPACPTGQYYSVVNPPTYSGCTTCLPAEYTLQNTYVSSICSNISSASIGYVNPPPLSFVDKFVKGSAYQKGSAGTYTQCSNVIPGSLQYVTSVCSLFSNTGITSLQSGFYYNKFKQGNPTTLGQVGEKKFPCSDVKTALDYVSAICTNVKDTSISNVKTTNSNGYYYSGFSQGTIYTLGNPGTLALCSLPGTNQYTTSPCTDTSNTVFGTFTTSSVVCPSTTTYYTKAKAGDAYTIGTDSNCATCSAQFQWKKTCSAPQTMSYYSHAGDTLTVDNLGNVYSLDIGSNNLYLNGVNKSSSTANFIKYYNSNIYSFDNGSKTIKKISTKTWTTTSFSTYPSGIGEPFINQVTGDIYVTDGKNVTVISQSKAVTTMTGTGTASSGYKGVVVDSQGFIYVANASSLRKYTNSLSFVTSLYSSPGIMGLTIDSNDNIFISTDTQIHLISPQGNRTTLYNGNITCIQADTSNVFYIDNYKSINKLY